MASVINRIYGRCKPRYGYRPVGTTQSDGLLLLQTTGQFRRQDESHAPPPIRPRHHRSIHSRQKHRLYNGVSRIDNDHTRLLFDTLLRKEHIHAQAFCRTCFERTRFRSIHKLSPRRAWRYFQRDSKYLQPAHKSHQRMKKEHEVALHAIEEKSEIKTTAHQQHINHELRTPIGV